MNPRCPHCERDLTDENRHPVVHYGVKAWCDPRCMSRDLDLGPDQMPDPDHDKLVLDTFEHYRDEMSTEAVEKLNECVTGYLRDRLAKQ